MVLAVWIATLPKQSVCQTVHDPGKDAAFPYENALNAPD